VRSRLPLVLLLACAAAGAAWLVAGPDREEAGPGVPGAAEGGSEPHLEGRGGGRPRPEEVVEVQILGPDGAPLSFARVTVGPRDGRHRFARVEGAPLRLPRALVEDGPIDLVLEQARAADGRALPKMVVRLGSADARRGVRIDAPRDVVVRVVDESGAAVPAASVVVYRDAPGEPGLTARRVTWTRDADDDGLARFEVLPVAPLFVRVESTAWWIPTTEAELGPTETDTVVVVPAGVAIEGRVVDPSGRGVAGAEVVASGWLEGDWWEAGATTMGDGGFRVSPVPARAVPRLVATAPRADTREDLGRAVLDDVRPGARDVLLRLPPGVSVRGIFEDERGLPLADVEATAVLLGDPAEAELEVHAERDGSFHLRRVAPGRYVVRAVQRRKEARRSGPVEIVAPSDDVRVVLRPAPTIAGRVVEERSVHGFGAWWFSGDEREQAAVEPSGAFELRGVGDAEGTLYVGGVKSNRYALLRGVRPGSERLEVTLRDGLEIHGSLEVPEGADVALVHVVLQGEGFELWAEVERDRKFRVLGVPPGAYEVSLSVDDRRGPTVARTSAGDRDLRLRLSR
jgi:hypothetical protein